MGAAQRFATVFALLLVLAQLTTAAPQPEGLVQLNGRDTIPPPPVITNGGYHYAPGVDMNDDSFATPAPPVIRSMTKDLVHPRQPSDSDDDSFIMPPPPTIQNGGLHFAPTPTSPSDGDTLATPAAPTITTVENRPPVIISGMSQLITSHVPVLTICPLPLPGPFVPSASGFPTAAYNSSTPPIPSGTLHPRQLIASRTVPVPPIKTAPFPSLHSPNISCSISYTTTTTPVCHTALSPFAAPVIPITACDESVAFGSEYGYRLVSGKSASVETLTTYFVAPWQDLHPGMVPMGNVLVVVCSSGRTDCTTESESWEWTITETYTTGFTTVDFEATVTGPANVIVGDLTTVAVSGTEPTTVSISTMMETTQTGTRLGIHRGATATESSGDRVGNVMTTVLHATTRTMTLPGTSGSEDVDG